MNPCSCGSTRNSQPHTAQSLDLLPASFLQSSRPRGAALGASRASDHIHTALSITHTPTHVTGNPAHSPRVLVALADLGPVGTGHIVVATSALLRAIAQPTAPSAVRLHVPGLGFQEWPFSGAAILRSGLIPQRPGSAAARRRPPRWRAGRRPGSAAAGRRPPSWRAERRLGAKT